MRRALFWGLCLGLALAAPAPALAAGEPDAASVYDLPLDGAGWQGLTYAEKVKLVREHYGQALGQLGLKADPALAARFEQEIPAIVKKIDAIFAGQAEPSGLF